MADNYSREKLMRIKEFKKIEAKYKQRKYQEAKRDLQDFILKYPYDDFGWYYYGKILMQEGRYTDALTIFYSRGREHNMMMQIDIIKCYLELSRFEEAYNLICSIRNIVANPLSNLFLRRAEIVTLKALGDIESLSFSDLGYIENQMIGYDRDEALKYTKELNMESKRLSKNISIDKLFSEVEEVIPQAPNLENTATLTETYLFRIPEIGISSGRKIDILKAVTAYKSENILSLYPATSIKNYPEYIISDQEKIKAKVLK